MKYDVGKLIAKSDIMFIEPLLKKEQKELFDKLNDNHMITITKSLKTLIDFHFGIVAEEEEMKKKFNRDWIVL